MSKGIDRLYEEKARANLRERESKTYKKLDETLSKLEEFIIEDVENLAPRERVSLYAQLIKYVITPAKAEAKGRAAKEGNMMRFDHASVFGNVLKASQTEA